MSLSLSNSSDESGCPSAGRGGGKDDGQDGLERGRRTWKGSVRKALTITKTITIAVDFFQPQINSDSKNIHRVENR